MTDRRLDVQQARVVDAAIRLDTLWGCVSAWHYLRARGIGRDVGLRVLSRQGRRRTGDAMHGPNRAPLAHAPAGGIA